MFPPFLFLTEKPDTLTCQIIQSEDFLPLTIQASLRKVQLPTSLQLMRTLKVGRQPLSVCHHNGMTYVGNDEDYTIERINADGEIQNNFIKLNGTGSSVKILNGELYVAVCDWISFEFTVRVFDLNGREQRNWEHEDSDNFLNQLGVYGDDIILPSRQSSTITVYNQTGDTNKSIKLPRPIDGELAMTAGENFVILSHCGSNCLFKVDINTSEALWTSRLVRNPRGVALLRDRYVLVTNDGPQTKIWILDCETGERSPEDL